MTDKSDRLELSEEAFRAHRSDIYRYLLRQTGDRHDAEELTQAVFAEAVVALPRLARRPDSLLAWLYTVAERRLIDEIRRRTYRRKRLHLLRRGEEVDPPTYGPAVAEAIRGAIASLPNDQRAVIVMRLFEEQPFAEIAKRLGATEAACKMRFARGIARVRELLAAEGFEP